MLEGGFRDGVVCAVVHGRAFQRVAIITTSIIFVVGFVTGAMKLSGGAKPAPVKGTAVPTRHDSSAIYVVTNDRPAIVPVRCTVPCMHSNRRVYEVVRRVRVEGLPFVFVQSMEGPAYYPQLRIDARHANQLWSTTSFRSTIPLPYFSWAEYQIQSPAVDYSLARKSASFIAKNCRSKNDRESLVRKLMQLTSVQSLSKCLHNAESPVGNSNKRRMMQQYLFTLAFENQCEEDYITEKLWGSLEAGTLPIYYGAPNIHDHVPEKSILSVGDYPSIEALAAHVNYLASNQSAYEEYHAWRKKPLPLWFVRKYNFTHTHSDCRLCQWARAELSRRSAKKPP